MTDRLALATRTMKARRRSTCSTCRRAILPGQQIARLTDPPCWIHVACVEFVQALQLLSRELGAEVIEVTDNDGIAHEQRDQHSDREQRGQLITGDGSGRHIGSDRKRRKLAQDGDDRTVQLWLASPAAPDGSHENAT